MNERRPYYNLEIEEVLIGSIFLDEEFNQGLYDSSAAFLHRGDLGKILTYTQSLVQKGKPVDMISIVEEAGLSS